MRKRIGAVLAMGWLLGSGLATSEESKPTATGSEGPAVVWTGWVSDEHCGATHTKPGGADCIRKCIKGGADIGHPEWKPQRMVFVADPSQKVWVVENPKILKGWEGQYVRIAARLDARQKSVRVEAVSVVEAKENRE